MIKKRIDIVFTGILLVLYVAFIGMDWLAPSLCLVSSTLKWCSIFLCNLYVWFVSKDTLLKISLGITLLCDLLLLFGTRELSGLIGMALFCIVHVLHAVRAAPQYEFGILIASSFIAVGALVVFSISSMLLVSQSALLSIGVCYSSLLMMNVGVSVQGMWKRWQPWPVSFLCATGALLFLLGDMFAGVDNANHFFVLYKVNHANAGKMVWVFYLPAQWALAKSALNLRKKLA